MGDTAEPEARPCHVLVVDDDDASRAVFRRALERAGYEVLEAGNGDDALATIDAVPVDLVLLDSYMPGLSGAEVLRRLRAGPTTQRLPVLFVTGHGDIEDRVQGLEAGADDYLVKPVELDELVARVHAQLRARDAWQDAVRELEQRAALADLIRSVPREGSPVETAAKLCSQLHATHPGGVAIVALFGRSAQVLGAAGNLSRHLGTADMLPRVDTEWLWERTQRGPWTESIGPDSPFAPTTLPTRLDHGVLAGAPIHDDHSVLGVSLVAGAPESDTAPRARELASAIDLAAVASILLSPALAAEGERTASIDRLRTTITERAFVPHFQPVVDLSTREVVGFEALSRFADGEPPDRWFAEAHRLRMVPELEHATIAAAIERGMELPHGGWLSVNVSADVVSAENGLADIVRGADRPVVLEITEYQPVADYGRLQEAFRRMGRRVMLAVDDAGTGYSSLRHILRLKPKFVKLDIEWIRAIETDPARQALIAGLDRFASTIGSTLIAEGVETEAENDCIVDLGVTLGQGYLFGRPAPIDALVRTA